MNDIDWTSLRHAYGEATDVPEILSALASGHASERAEGVERFFAALCHQGTVYPASLAAIPSLLELLRAARGDAREDLLTVLAALAAGHGDGVSMTDVHAAIAGETALLAEIVVNGAPRERALALKALASPAFAAAADAVVGCARAPPGPARVRAHGWEALQRIAPERLPGRVEDDDAAVVLCAALGRLRVEGDHPSDATLDLVAQGLADRATVDRVEAWAAAMDTPTPLWACAADLRAQAPRTLPAMAGRMMDLCDTLAATELAELLLDAAFAPSHESVDLSALSPKQRAVLEALAHADAVWEARGAFNGNLLSALGRYGLPSWFDARQTLVNALDLSPRPQVVVVTPRVVRGAREIAASLGRTAWLDVPFVFLRDAPDFSQDIPEDPDDFPPAVMQDFLAISRPIRAMVLWHTCPVDTAAFYPQLTPSAFLDVARAHGCEVVAPNMTHAEEVFDEARWESDPDGAF
ncbi:MAG: hypothetical protein U0325_25555 [Polyangiales bacterium]